MAVTILQRPEGHVLSTTANTATVDESYGAGDAQFVSPTVHNLNDGDYIYSESDIEDYAGFFYVDILTTGIFKLRPYPTGGYVQFIANGSITWYASTLTHGWSCVHLPITYRISNNLYPVNSADTTRTITSVTDSNGYSVIHLSGSLGSAVNSYDFVKVTAPNDTGLSNVYQILEFISPTVMIINLAYDPTNNFTSATALKHYNNYNFIVRVYAGINASHQWTAQKPYELAATLQFIPDDNNEAFFSVNEILKSYIETRNNLQLGTLPNNIDFWANFYIETAESYDDSDGYVFGTFTGNYTSDQSNFEGTAVNAKLEFKNAHSGYLSAYLMPIKWLTLFNELSVFIDQYFDISFLNPINNLTLGYKVNGAVYSFATYGDQGVYRFKPTIIADSSVYIVATGVSAQPTNNTFTGSLSPWANIGTTGVNWSYNSNKARVVLTAGQASNYLSQLYTVFANPDAVNILTVSIDYTNTAPNPAVTMEIVGINPGETPHILSSAAALVSAAATASFTINAVPSNYQYFGVTVTNGSGSPVTVDIDNVTFALVASWAVSDELVINLNTDCSKQQVDLQWLNNLGGFDAWRFTGKKDHIVEITEALETKKNILPNWPKSYGASADTIRKQTLRTSNKSYVLRSQYVTEEQLDAIAFIGSSVLVQIVNSRGDSRTVIVGTDSFFKRKDGDKTFEISFTVSFTDDIPSQTT